MEKYEEIDIKRILEITYSKKIFIILILLLSITLGYVYSYYYKKPEYKSSVKILLVADESKTNKELTQTDLNINSGLISTYSSIAKSTNVIQKTIDNLGLNTTALKLQKYIETTQVEKTQFLKISVKNENPETAKNIANELAKVFTEQIKKIYKLENISIVDEAEVEKQPCNINHMKDICVFAIICAFISTILVIAIYFFDDTIKDEKDLEKSVKLKSLGTLPKDNENEELIVENNPKSHVVECIKTIRTNILYSTNKRTILITSNKPKEGKSWVTNNLAVAFAEAGKKVILVDTDLRKRSNRNELFKIEEKEGLSDFIREITDDEIENLEKTREYIKETEIPNLHILQNGTLPPNPAELISSNNMRKLLELLKNMYDIILLDGTACTLVSDSIALSTMVDSTILVAESKKTKTNDLKRAKKLIEDVNGKISGVILNKSEIQKGKYYGKRYGYYYGKDIDEIEDEEKIEEQSKRISLEEIIELAKDNIKQKALLEEIIEEKEEQIQEENKNDKEEIIKIRNEIIRELKNIKITFLEQQKINNDKENNKKIQKIEEKNEENLKSIMQSVMNEINKLNSEIENLKELQVNSNTELLNKVENINYEKELTKINEEINNIKNKEKMIKEDTKIEEKSSNNIINFETFREKRRKTKKVFQIDESITFDDLQRLSTQVIDLSEDSISDFALSN